MNRVLAAIALVISTSAQAEVISSTPNAFVIRNSVEVPLAPAAAYERFTQPGQWWLDSHTYSADSSNMSIDARPGGCFCERTAGGGVEHLRVSHVDEGKRLVLSGALGPLLFEAAAGVMDIQFEPAGADTKVTMTYKAAGFAGGGADKLAPIVDRVLRQQLESYAAVSR